MKYALFILTIGLLGAQAHADMPVQAPRVGGHFNLAIPVVTWGASTQTIGTEYTKVGLAPGVTYKLDENWGIDLEFVAYNNFRNGGMSSLVVDPGVIYNFGAFTGGLRAAVAVGATNNYGFIPIAVKTFSIGLVRFLVELDVPIFIRQTGTDVTIQPQLGVAF